MLPYSDFSRNSPMTDLPPFLTNAQVEELEQHGMIELTDEILDAMFAWAYPDEQVQADA